MTEIRTVSHAQVPHGQVKACQLYACSKCTAVLILNGTNTATHTNPAARRLGWKLTSANGWTCPTCYEESKR